MSKDKKNESTALAAAATTALAAAADYGDMAGAGFENQTSADVAVPFLGVLQGLSPEVGKGPKGIKGASPGMLINTVTKELFDGDTGVIFQPVDTRHVFVEWKPRDQGGGFVAEHATDAKVVLDCKANQEFGSYKTPAGNDLIETFYVTGLMHRSDNLDEQAANAPEPMMIAFSSTKIRPYKAIMTRLRTVKGNPPLFAHRIRITTAHEERDSGASENFSLKPLVNDDVKASLIPARLGNDLHPLLVAGQALLKASRSGEVKQASQERESGGGGKKDADIPF